MKFWEVTLVGCKPSGRLRNNANYAQCLSFRSAYAYIHIYIYIYIYKEREKKKKKKKERERERRYGGNIHASN
jgi:hypothetical protein